jgi:protein-S-isoprenylcysteine O-methyltransferase Ste14
MFNNNDLVVFLDKVPALRSPWKAILTVLYVVALSAICVLFFNFIDASGIYAPLISQFVMAIVIIVLEIIHLRTAAAYRVKHGALAYQVHFYHLMLPILITWYACCFHPAFIGGERLLPPWMAVCLGILVLIPAPFIGIHIETAGFHMMTHGLDVYSVFPEETPAVYGAIYSHIRHPLYLVLACMTFALAFFRNNAVSLLAAVLILIPALVTGYLEDQELIRRYGEAHRAYIRKTSALLPLKHPMKFLKLLFFIGK